MSNVAYIRVSSYSQNTDRQLAGLAFDKTFEEKASAKDTNRPQLAECLRYLREGDTLHVHSLDRLARNMEDLLRLVRELTGRGVAIKFHKENLEFSGDASPLHTLMLQMLGSIAEFERALINERRKEGMAEAKAKGKQVGAKVKLSDQQIAELKARIADGEEKKALAKEFGISRTTLYGYVTGCNL
jgi:DNA invertase Pin-like site-specific DNA recombinase